METGKKILIVYYSRSGNTQRVSNDVAKELGADTEKLTDKTSRSGFWGFITGGRDAMKERETVIEPVQKDPSKYDIVILGTPIWAGKMAPAIRTYINQNKTKISKTAYIITSGGTDAGKVATKMDELTGKQALGYLGVLEKELKKEVVYKEKLNKFVEVLKK
ncbi:MAG: hypothetical protein A2252_09450 [Elusimicrobia bacterium RIFOXYA2_FULL_39_19]|nr:MAG: hypothetical protein A2252_09450 [Elusimicrobia bacterium RIFOXYA2_FULL_39_19]